MQFGEDLLSINWHVLRSKESLGKTSSGFKKTSNSQTLEGFFKPSSLNHISSFDHLEKRDNTNLKTEKNLRSISYYEQREKEISKLQSPMASDNREKPPRFYRKSLLKWVKGWKNWGEDFKRKIYSNRRPADISLRECSHSCQIQLRYDFIYSKRTWNKIFLEITPRSRSYFF